MLPVVIRALQKKHVTKYIYYVLYFMIYKYKIFFFVEKIALLYQYIKSYDLSQRFQPLVMRANLCDLLINRLK